MASSTDISPIITATDVVQRLGAIPVWRLRSNIGGEFATANDVLGRVLGPDGMVRLNPDSVRIPDVSFISNARFAKIAMHERIWQVVPNLAVEILSDGNTVEEMDRKLRDYFEHGVEEVWYVEPSLRSIRVYESVATFQVAAAGQVFKHSHALAGFEFPVDRLFQLPI